MDAIIVYLTRTGEHLRTVYPAPNNILGPVAFYTRQDESGILTTRAEIEAEGAEALLHRYLTQR